MELNNSFAEYQTTSHSLTFDKMQTIHDDLLSELVGDEEAEEIYADFVAAATKYAKVRADWLLLPLHQRAQQDSIRTALHNSTIYNINILARYLRMQGKEALWRDNLGDEKLNPYYRKTIGDFACYVVFVNSINAR